MSLAFDVVPTVTANDFGEAAQCPRLQLTWTTTASMAGGEGIHSQPQPDSHTWFDRVEYGVDRSVEVDTAVHTQSYICSDVVRRSVVLASASSAGDGAVNRAAIAGCRRRWKRPRNEEGPSLRLTPTFRRDVFIVVLCRSSGTSMDDAQGDHSMTAAGVSGWRLPGMAMVAACGTIQEDRTAASIATCPLCVSVGSVRVAPAELTTIAAHADSRIVDVQHTSLRMVCHASRDRLVAVGAVGCRGGAPAFSSFGASGENGTDSGQRGYISLHVVGALDLFGPALVAQLDDFLRVSLLRHQHPSNVPCSGTAALYVVGAAVAWGGVAVDSHPSTPSSSWSLMWWADVGTVLLSYHDVRRLLFLLRLEGRCKPINGDEVAMLARLLTVLMKTAAPLMALSACLQAGVEWVLHRCDVGRAALFEAMRCLSFSDGTLSAAAWQAVVWECSVVMLQLRAAESLRLTTAAIAAGGGAGRGGPMAVMPRSEVSWWGRVGGDVLWLKPTLSVVAENPTGIVRIDDHGAHHGSGSHPATWWCRLRLRIVSNCEHLHPNAAAATAAWHMPLCLRVTVRLTSPVNLSTQSSPPAEVCCGVATTPCHVVLVPCACGTSVTSRVQFDVFVSEMLHPPTIGSASNSSPTVTWGAVSPVAAEDAAAEELWQWARSVVDVYGVDALDAQQTGLPSTEGGGCT